jgi:diguanylate cyclase (GGDEF)-like protein
MAERCRQAVEAVRVAVGQEVVGVTASFGVADSRGLASPEALIESADQALYAAKAAGRNAVRMAEVPAVAPNAKE